MIFYYIGTKAMTLIRCQNLCLCPNSGQISFPSAATEPHPVMLNMIELLQAERTVLAAAGPGSNPDSCGPLLHVISSLSASSCPVYLNYPIN